MAGDKTAGIVGHIASERSTGTRRHRPAMAAAFFFEHFFLDIAFYRVPHLLGGLFHLFEGTRALLEGAAQAVFVLFEQFLDEGFVIGSRVLWHHLRQPPLGFGRSSPEPTRNPSSLHPQLSFSVRAP